MKSIWLDSSSLPVHEPLSGNIKTDVLIIGGGMAGILCAYYLQKAGVKCVVVEGKTVASGITKNTTAKITSQHGLLYDQLLNNMGKEKAAMYLRSNELALNKFREISKKMDCDFEDKDAYVYSINNKQKIENEVNALNKIGFDADYVEHLPLPFQTAGAVQFKKQGQFHPLKFITPLIENLNLYENTFINAIDHNTAITKNGRITADKIIVATHFPFINRHGSYFLKLYQHRSYVIALSKAPYLDGMYVDEAMNGLSFRNYKDLLLLGGGDHRTGKRGGNWEELRKFVKHHYPGAAEKYNWATQDCMSLDHVPYIGQYSKKTPNLYVASGFNKWGMTSSMVSAIILTDMVMGKRNEFAEVYSPQRSMCKPQLFINGLEATRNFLIPTVKRCPHMGCALKWNPNEHSWDCSCHGSRFEENGKLIDNPSMKSLGIKKK